MISEEQATGVGDLVPGVFVKPNRWLMVLTEPSQGWLRVVDPNGTEGPACVWQWEFPLPARPPDDPPPVFRPSTLRRRAGLAITKSDTQTERANILMDLAYRVERFT